MDLNSVNLQKALTNKNVLMGLPAETQECIIDCVQCHLICEQVIQHGLNVGGKQAEVATIRILQDCVQTCLITADFMLRQSNMVRSVCKLCAEICTTCGAECERLSDDERMDLCGDICQRCAKSCTAMAHIH